MSNLNIVLACLCLAACSVEEGRSHWSKAPQHHDCTQEQMALVEMETRFCINTTTYFSAYCYGTAILRHCTLREKTNDQK